MTQIYQRIIFSLFLVTLMIQVNPAHAGKKKRLNYKKANLAAHAGISQATAQSITSDLTQSTASVDSIGSIREGSATDEATKTPVSTSNIATATTAADASSSHSIPEDDEKKEREEFKEPFRSSTEEATSTLPARNFIGESQGIEIEVSEKSLKNLLRHFVGKIDRDGQISGFHLYPSSFLAPVSKDKFNQIKINQELSIFVPSDMNLNAFHGGYVVQNETNLGWKSFFPQDWGGQELVQYLMRAVRQRFNRLDELDRGKELYRIELAPVPGLFPTPSILIYDAARKIIKTVYPKVPPSSAEGLFNAIKGRTIREISNEIPEKISEYFLDDLRLILDHYDVDALKALKENNADLISRALKDLLRESIRNIDRERVENILRGIGDEIDKSAWSVDAFRKINLDSFQKDSDQAKQIQFDQAQIVEMLLQATNHIENGFIDRALDSNNQMLVENLISWCIRNEKITSLEYILERRGSILSQHKALRGFLIKTQNDLEGLRTLKDLEDLNKNNKTSNKASNTTSEEPLTQEVPGPLTSELTSSLTIQSTSESDSEEEENHEEHDQASSFYSTHSRPQLSVSDQKAVTEAFMQWSENENSIPSTEIFKLFFDLSAEETKSMLLPYLLNNKSHMCDYLYRKYKSKINKILRNWSIQDKADQAVKRWFILHPASLEKWLVISRNELSDETLKEILIEISQSGNSGNSGILKTIEDYLKVNSKKYPASLNLKKEKSSNSTNAVSLSSTPSSVNVIDMTTAHPLLDLLTRAMAWGKPAFAQNESKLVNGIKWIIQNGEVNAIPKGSTLSWKQLASNVITKKSSFLSQSLKSYLNKIANPKQQNTASPASSSSSGSGNTQKAPQVSESSKQDTKPATKTDAKPATKMDTKTEAPLASSQPTLEFTPDVSGEAEYNLGLSYLGTEGTPRDEKKAFEMFTRAAKKGHVQAQYELGRMYMDGIGTVKNLPKAFKWMLEAAKKGHTEAQYQVALMFYDGKGTPKNPSEAFRWMSEAAKKEHSKAQCELGEIYLHGRLGIAKNSLKAFKLMTQAAQKDDTGAQANLGLMYVQGIGTSKNLPAALRLLILASEKGSLIAQYNLGNLYLIGGEGVPKNLPEAFRWMTEAAEQGDVDARYQLGVMYVQEITPPDYKSASKWMTLAAGQGHEGAVKALKLIRLRQRAQ